MFLISVIIILLVALLFTNYIAMFPRVLCTVEDPAAILISQYNHQTALSRHLPPSLFYLTASTSVNKFICSAARIAVRLCVSKWLLREQWFLIFHIVEEPVHAYLALHLTPLWLCLWPYTHFSVLLFVLTTVSKKRFKTI